MEKLNLHTYQQQLFHLERPIPNNYPKLYKIIRRAMDSGQTQCVIARLQPYEDYVVEPAGIVTGLRSPRGELPEKQEWRVVNDELYPLFRWLEETHGLSWTLHVHPSHCADLVVSWKTLSSVPGDLLSYWIQRICLRSSSADEGIWNGWTRRVRRAMDAGQTSCVIMLLQEGVDYSPAGKLHPKYDAHFVYWATFHQLQYELCPSPDPAGSGEGQSYLSVSWTPHQ